MFPSKKSCRFFNALASSFSLNIYTGQQRRKAEAMYHCAEMAVNLSQLLKYFRKGERTDQISKLTNKSAATSGKRKSLTSDQETEFIFLFDPSEGRFNSGIQVLRSYLSYIYCKFLLKIKCCQISFAPKMSTNPACSKKVAVLGEYWPLVTFSQNMDLSEFLSYCYNLGPIFPKTALPLS